VSNKVYFIGGRLKNWSIPYKCPAEEGRLFLLTYIV
jgi:hypothetical protein